MEELGGIERFAEGAAVAGVLAVFQRLAVSVSGCEEADGGFGRFDRGRDEAVQRLAGEAEGDGRWGW